MKFGPLKTKSMTGCIAAIYYKFNYYRNIKLSEGGKSYSSYFNESTYRRTNYAGDDAKWCAGANLLMCNYLVRGK